MASTHVDYTTMEWISGAPFYGPAAVYDGKDIVQLKVLSDRRRDGGGIAWLVKFSPPPGKLIKIVATALSDEHIFSLQGGRSTKSGQRAQGSGGYGLNPKGQPHSAMISSETEALVIYAGEPDEIKSMEIVDIAPAGYPAGGSICAALGVNDHPGEDVGLQHHQHADQAGQHDGMQEHEAQDRPLVAKPVGGGGTHDDRLRVEHLAHDAARGIFRGHQDRRQPQLLGGDLLQAAEQHVRRGVRPGERHPQPAQQG